MSICRDGLDHRLNDGDILHGRSCTKIIYWKYERTSPCLVKSTSWVGKNIASPWNYFSLLLNKKPQCEKQIFKYQSQISDSLYKEVQITHPLVERGVVLSSPVFSSPVFSLRFFSVGIFLTNLHPAMSFPRQFSSR